ncbi:hypothetical protein M413DRAFT_26737 [Hebeloma cylindrosporum]|uniref:Fungal-type protein kinase domain-containing protein n=1 Tax=Hebeloma cylindrosporum TaxID=76867 RepID=A0A0C3CGK4_HEBCY|nr:hypothetical protein M413DRAFT_26737 [Hebeloma cylindrosporum h7]
MSIEVAGGEYLFEADSEWNCDVPNPRFFHSPLHDLEFLWWILVWFLFLKTAKQPNEGEFTPPETQIYAQYEHAFSCFPSQADERTTPSRIKAMLSENLFSKCVAESLPKYVAEYGFHLGRLTRVEIFRDYEMDDLRKLMEEYLSKRTFQFHLDCLEVQ